MSPKIEIFRENGRGKIARKSRFREYCHGDRTRTPRHAVRAGAQSALAVIVDDPSRQPYPAQCRRLEGRWPSGFLCLARHHHVGVVFLSVAAAGPRRGEAACKPRVSRDPVSVRPPDPREAGKFPRLQGCAVLSVAHQGHRRRRFLHRLGRPWRGPDIVRLAGAGLCQGAWLGQGSPRGANDSARRRCRDGRGQYLRSASGGLETRPAQCLVGG